MRQTRRGFLEALSGGRSDADLDGRDTALWIAARGHEEYQAQAAQVLNLPGRSCRRA